MATPTEDSIIGGIDFDELFFDEGTIIGEGGNGEVYSGKYKGLSVAIKKQSRVRFHKDRSFMREIEFLKGLSHPNIMQYIGSCEHNGEIYIVTQLLGENLREACILKKESQPPSLFQRMKYAHDGAVGIRWLHEHSAPIIHRDIKPENFLLTLDNTHAVVCDFGISKFESEELAESSSKKRRGKTPLWASPEVNNGGLITTKSDVYSFGLFLWSMLTLCDPPAESVLSKKKNHSQIFIYI